MELPRILRIRQGFTLVELTVVLLVVSLMVGFGMQAMQVSTSTDCYAKTRDQLSTIREAMKRFVDTNARLPLPAGRSFGVTSPYYGREVANSSTGANGDLDDIDSCATCGSDSTGILYGALPFQALQLPASFAADCWGNKFSYMVTTNLITAANYVNFTGNIEIRNGKSGVAGTDYTQLTTRGGWVVISHGMDGKGGVKANYSTASHAWAGDSGTSCSTTHEDRANCDRADNIIYASDVVNGSDTTSYYDDIVAYSDKLLLTNVYCWGNSASSGTNSYALGNGTTSDSTYPAPVGVLMRFTQIFGPVPLSYGSSYSGNRSYSALTSDGTPYCWGNNSNSQLGGSSATYPSYSIPTAQTMGNYKFKTMAISNDLSCGVVRNDGGGTGTDGEIRCWGTGSNGSLGNGSASGTVTTAGTLSNTNGAASRSFTKIYISGYSTQLQVYAIDTSGYVWAWGQNNASKLGGAVASRATSSISSPEKVTKYNSPTGADISFSKLSIADGHVCALTTWSAPATGGHVYCWGRNDSGQLGRGSRGTGSGYTSVPTVTMTSPGTCTATFTARLNSDAIGAIDFTPGTGCTNNYYSLIFTGGGGSGASAYTITSLMGTNQIAGVILTADSPNMEEVSGSHLFTDLAGDYNYSGYSTCALDDGGQVLCWGQNSFGQLGVGGTAYGGQGYDLTSTPSVYISDTGGTPHVTYTGTPSVTATVSGGKITGYTVVDGGNDFTNPGNTRLYLSGGGGYGTQTYNGMAPTMGGPITAVTVTNGGAGYAGCSSVTLSINGAGSGTGFTSTVNRSGGTISSVTVNTQGDRYTYNATGTISGANCGTGNPTTTATVTLTIRSRILGYWFCSSCYSDILVPTAVDLSAFSPTPSFRQVRMGYYAAYAISTTNTLYSWGLNSYGNLGTGNTTSYNSPQLISNYNKTNTSNAGPDSALTLSSSFNMPGAGAAACLLDTNSKLYCPGTLQYIGNGTASGTTQNYYAATCPTTPYGSIPSCSYAWSTRNDNPLAQINTLVVDGNVCGILQ